MNRNVDEYIQKRVDRHLHKSIDTVIDKKLREYSNKNFASSSIKKHESYAFRDFKQQNLNAPVAHVFSQAFNSGFSNSQFMNIFSSEIRKSILRS